MIELAWYGLRWVVRRDALIKRQKAAISAKASIKSNFLSSTYVLTS